MPRMARFWGLFLKLAPLYPLAIDARPRGTDRVRTGTGGRGESGFMPKRVVRLLSDLSAGRRRAEFRAIVTRGVFPAWLYRSNQMVVVRLSESSARPLPRPLPEASFRWATREDEPLLQSIRPRRSPYSAQLDKGAKCLLGTIDGAPASFNFFEFGEWHTSPANGYRFRLGPGASWAYGMEVAPRFRMSGIFHKHFLDALRMLREDLAIDRIYGSVQGDNPLSLNSHRRLGFIPLYRFRVVRIAGIEYFVALPSEPPEEARRGFGVWNGEDRQLVLAR